ncbi:polysaccharide biosynthesis C-terminal domain-containing protein [soil metagenome]|nr:polysaccharide biosynthesis C-terminal domain-containing protein [Acidobacteriota bacterium]
MLQKLRQLSKDSAIYGLGDIGVSIVNFLLLPLYVQYLSDTDYGVLGLLGAVEVMTKIVARWGLDGSFMRFFYDCEGEPDRQRLASTIFFFLVATNGVLLAVSLLSAPWLAGMVLGDRGQTLALRLVLLNTFVIGFTFLPFHVLRIQKRALQFSVLTLARSVTTVAVRLLLIVGFGYGVLGVVLADVLVTGLLMVVLARWFAPLIRPMFSRRVLRESLAFGLPRLPHAAAQQVIAVGDKLILQAFRPLAEVGMYAMGVSFGLTLKLFLSAFEYAWAPFYYASAREPGAPAVFRTVTTYGVAGLVLLAAGMSAVARDLLDLMTRGLFVEAAPVVAWTAVGVLFQGVYLMTSIGLNLTKRTAYYPVATLSAAAANIGLNLALIPRFGALGAAWANAAAYALQAVIAFRFSQRFYPVPHEYGRLARVGVAGLAAYAAAVLIPPFAPVVGIAVRGATVLGIFLTLLWTTGFFKSEELAVLARLRRSTRRARTPARPPETTELAGEIVATELAAEELGGGPPQPGTAGGARND